MILPHKYLPSTSVRLKQVKYRSFGILTEPNNAEPNHMIKEDKDFTLFFHFFKYRTDAYKPPEVY